MNMMLHRCAAFALAAVVLLPQFGIPRRALGSSAPWTGAQSGVKNAVHRPPPRIVVPEPPRRARPAMLPAGTIHATISRDIRRPSGSLKKPSHMLRPSEIDRVVSAARRRAATEQRTRLNAGQDTLVPRTAAPGGVRGIPGPGSARGAAAPPASALRTTRTLPGPVPGTGINPWWRYREEVAANGGRLMVNAGTGNMLLQDDDMRIPHKGMALSFRRTYNSQSGHDVIGTDGTPPSMYGNGWTSTFDAHLSGSSTGTMSVWDIDGARYDYTLAADGVTRIPPPGQHATLVSDNSCGYLWTKKSGVSYYFYTPDGSGATCPSWWWTTYGAYGGRLYQIIGRNRYTHIMFNYYWDNGNSAVGGKISTIVAQTESGLTATLSFADVSGYRLLQQIVFPDGVTAVGYGYDASGNLSYVSRPPNNSQPPNNTAGTRPTYFFGYQGVGARSVLYWTSSPRWTGSEGGYDYFLFTGTDASTATVNAVVHVGVVNWAPPDGTGALLQSNAPTGVQQYLVEWYGTGGTTPWFFDSDNHRTQWITDSVGRPTQTQQCTATSGWNCTGTWLVTNQTWDADNNLAVEVDPRGNETDFLYDPMGNTTAVGQPYTTTSHGSFKPTRLFDYDAFNNVTAYCDESQTHAMNGDWTPATTSIWPDDSLCAMHTNVVPHWHATYAYPSYEPYGELSQMTTALGYSTTFSYDPAPQGGTDYGLPTAVSGAPIAQSDGTIQPYQTIYYDGHGNMVCSRRDGNALNTTTVFAYDALNRVTTIADPDDSSVGTPAQCSTRSSDIPGSTIVTSKTYYPDGSVASVQSPAEFAANVATTYQYDLSGNMTSEQQHHTSNAAATVRYYDGANRLVEVVQPPDPTDLYPYPWTTRYLYDLQQGGTNTVGTSTPFKAYGHLYKTQERLPGAVVDWYAWNSITGAGSFLDITGTAFDAVDRAVLNFRDTGSGLQTVTNTYDSSPGTNGLLASTCNALNECQTVTYDERGHETAFTFNVASSTPQHFSYDENGRTVYSANDVATLTETYDGDGRKSSSTQSVTGGASAAITYHYYPNGSRSGLDISLSGGSTYPNALTYTYRADGTPRRVGVMGTANAFSYQFTGGRRILSRSDSTGASALSFSYGAVGPSSFAAGGYPAVGFPTGISAPYWYEQSLHYDAEGGYVTGDNWIYLNGGFFGDSVPVYRKSARGETFKSTENVRMANGVRIGAQNFHYVYNALQGFPIRIEAGDTDVTYAYDSAGRQVSTVSADGISDVFTKQYDVEDHLVLEQFTSGVIGNSRVPRRWSVGYRWGPAGHAVAIGSTSVASSSQQQPVDLVFDSLFWDDDTLLFTVNSSGQLADLKIGDFADYFPGTATPLVVANRDNIGVIRDCHRNGGGAATGANGTSLKVPTCDMTPGHAPSRQGPYLVGRGAMLAEPKDDGVTDGFNTVQGVRTFDPQSGVWNSPDSYRGNTDDPMSQKPYMWNRNDPNGYSDPSGFEPLRKPGPPCADGFGWNGSQCVPESELPDIGGTHSKKSPFGPLSIAFGSVYVSKNPAYIGRSQNFASRARDWARAGRSVEEIRGTKDLSKYDSHCLEGYLICKYGLKSKGGRLVNKINGVDPTKPTGGAQLQRGAQIYEEIGSPEIFPEDEVPVRVPFRPIIFRPWIIP
jgi:YD repeat-containing protein